MTGQVKKQTLRIGLLFLAGVLAVTFVGFGGELSAQPQEESGSVGIEGTVPGNPPTTAPTITVPKTGQTFSSVPISVSGLCQSGLLVEVFKNKVFSGAVDCVGGSYSVQIDLFVGKNDLIARHYDALDQAGPDSNVVSVTFSDGQKFGGPRISLFSAYAKRGALPGSSLTWPLTLSGGQAPYAVSVDWGDKSTPDLISQPTAGDFSISHIYKQAGVYKVTIKASDANGVSAYLQVVGVGNGPIKQSKEEPTVTVSVDKSLPLVFWIIVGLAVPVLIVSFWLGKKHQLQEIRDRLHRGERPLE